MDEKQRDELYKIFYNNICIMFEAAIKTSPDHLVLLSAAMIRALAVHGMIGKKDELLDGDKLKPDVEDELNLLCSTIFDLVFGDNDRTKFN